MESFQHLLNGFGVALSPLNLLFATIGCVLGALLASLLLMKTLGFSLTILGFSIFLLRALGRQPWWITLVLSVVGSFGLFYVFDQLQVMLPTGILGI